MKFLAISKLTHTATPFNTVDPLALACSGPEDSWPKHCLTTARVLGDNAGSMD
jgi:hypothetical protein